MRLNHNTTREGSPGEAVVLPGNTPAEAAGTPIRLHFRTIRQQR